MVCSKAPEHDADHGEANERLNFWSDFIHWRRSGESWPSVWPGRAECLNAHWFLSLADAREKLEDWRKYYNEECPHGAIGQKTPIMLLNHVGAASPPS